MNVVDDGALSRDKAPVYLRIQRHFLDRIAAGELTTGERLPTEVEIAKAFGTSRATVQSAMSRLVHEGWIEKQAGRGTFVAETGRSSIIDLHHVRSFEDDVASQGHQVTYRLLHVGREAASEEVAGELGIEPGTEIFAFERLRLVGGNIIGMEHRFFAPHIVLDFPLDAFDTVSTHDLVGGHLKQRIGRIEVAIHAAVAQPDIAAKLDAPAGSPLLLRRHTMFSTDGRVILYGEAHYREPFAFRYVAEAGQQF